MSMKTPQASLQAAAVVASLLDRLDASTQPVDAHQYQVVAERLAALLRQAGIDAADVTPLLEESPAAATVYENLRYGEAGLCRAPLAVAAATEQETRAVIALARRIRPNGWTRSLPAEA